MEKEVLLKYVRK